MKSHRVIIMADLHCGHRVGLTPPCHQPTVPEDTPLEHLKKLGEMRKHMWSWFEKTMAKYRPIHTLIVNGDAIEGKGNKSGGVELITADREEQTEIAADAINFVQASAVWATYGTPYHVGQDEDWENVLYSKVKNFRKIEAEGHYNINGLQVVCKHYLGNTSSTASRATALSNAQIRQILWHLRGQQPLANLIVRSHVHRCVNFGDPGMNFSAWSTPALQGLGTKYGARQCDGLPVDFGFLVLDVKSKSDWGVTAEILPMSYASGTVDGL